MKIETELEGGLLNNYYEATGLIKHTVRVLNEYSTCCSISGFIFTIMRLRNDSF